MFRPLVHLFSNQNVMCEVIKQEKYVKSYKLADTQFRDLIGGIKFRDVKHGDGETVERGDIVNVQYTGRLLGGREMETTTHRSGSTVVITAGGSEVIRGVSEGVIGMKEYGSRELLLAPSMHYEHKFPKQIMIYDVMVRTIVRKGSKQTTN